jgi:glucoamylase
VRVKNRRTGKDINTVLSSTHNFDPTLLCDAATLQPCSDMALANHKAVVDSFRNWPLNRGAGPGQAVAVGRYREDKYFGGNPWYLATLAAGEQLHDALYVWEQRGWVEINNLSLPLFKDLLPDVEVGVYGKDKGSDTYREVMRRVARYADGFMEVVAANMGRDGSMAEQFSRKNGKPVSAAHLTWSYDAFVVAAWRRARRLPPSWASGFDKSLLTNVAAECNPVTRKGTYLVPTATWFPPSQTPRVDFPTRVSPFNTEAVNAPSSSATAM